MTYDGARVSHGIDQLLHVAAQTCLGGRAPITNEDWCQILNYVALNLEEPAFRVLEIMDAVRRYSGQPWTPVYVAQVYRHQRAERRRLGLLPRPGETDERTPLPPE